MTTTTFDSLGYFEKLKEAGVPEAQARVQAEAMREFTSLQEERARQELATKGDLRETELRLQTEIEKVRSEIRATELRLLKWQFGIGLALAAIMAKGFGWLGF